VPVVEEGRVEQSSRQPAGRGQAARQPSPCVSGLESSDTVGQVYPPTSEINMNRGHPQEGERKRTLVDDWRRSSAGCELERAIDCDAGGGVSVRLGQLLGHLTSSYLICAHHVRAVDGSGG
jgi:hypothetical protein